MGGGGWVDAPLGRYAKRGVPCCHGGVMMRVLKRLLDPRELQENRYLPGNPFVSLLFLN